MTYILTWNKDKWPETEMQKLMDDFAAGREVTNRWKCASHKQCNIGDRVFLSRTGQQFPGLIGSGKIISDAYQDEDFEDPSKIAWYVTVRFDYLTPSPSKVVISHAELGARLGVSARVFTPQASGMPFTGNHLQLETLWSRLIGNSSLIYPDDVNASEHRHVEGAVQQVTVNRYERAPSARRRCIEFHGASCKACGLNMAHVYGPDLGRDYIHVHHVIPLHTIKDSYVIDPEKELIPLCPNCHSMVHQSNPPLSVDELRSKIMPRYIALFS